MAPAVAYPPTILHPSSLKPLSVEDAQKTIAKYLSDSERKPYLHPDARLEPRSVALSTLGSRQGGVILHQLRRVEAGLRGEVLQPEPRTDGDNGILVDAEATSELPLGNDAALDAMIEAANQEMDDEDVDSSNKRKANAMDTDGDNEDWQDPEEMDMQMEGTEDGPLHDQTTAVAEGGQVPALKSAEKLDKEARKKAKKEKRKEEQKSKEAARRNKANATISTITDEAADVEDAAKAQSGPKEDQAAKKKVKKDKRERGDKKRKKHHDDS